MHLEHYYLFKIEDNHSMTVSQYELHRWLKELMI